jgi:FkbM family methyltransferase
MPSDTSLSPTHKLVVKTVSGVETKAIVREGKTDEFIVREVSSYSKLQINETDIVVDLGLQIGMFSVWVLNRGAKKVYSYEPNEDNFALAEKNLPLNGFAKSRYSLFKRAVIGNDDKTRDFYLNGQKNTGGHSLLPKRGREVVSVKCININAVIRKHKPTVLKMDIEGAEYECLKAIESFEGIRELIFEFHHADLKDIDSHAKYNEILKLLRKHFRHIDARKDTKGAWVNLVYCKK